MLKIVPLHSWSLGKGKRSEVEALVFLFQRLRPTFGAYWVVSC